MATFTVNIAESINVWGGEPTSKWGVMSWGNTWAFGTEDLIVTVFIDEEDTISISDDWSLVATFNRSFSETITTLGAMSDQTKIDANGYRDVFVGGSTNAEDRSLTPFTEQTPPDDSYSEVSRPTTDWSES